MYIFDIYSNGSFLQTIGVESDSENQAKDFASHEFPNKTSTYVRRVSKVFHVTGKDDDFGYNFTRFKRIQIEYGFYSVWSKYDISNIEDLAPFSFNMVMLKDIPHSLTKVSLNNHTWLEIWSIADRLIRLFGPTHPYIEGFEVIDNTLYVTTGS
jgi:hypothetical protein